MSPFRAQVRLLRKMAREGDLRKLNIGPMEAFQGLESRFVILCTTRARRRFLDDDGVGGAGIVGEPKKLNLAITRPKEGLVVIGNPWVLGMSYRFLDACSPLRLWLSLQVYEKRTYTESNYDRHRPLLACISFLLSP